MSHFQHHLIYCTDNESVALEIANDLRTSGHSFELHGIADGAGQQSLRSLQISPSNGKILLLVTDNFLKTANCLDSTLPVIRNWANADVLVPVVADGSIVREDGKVEVVETSFDRVSNIIQYMNYWQDKYLEYRKLKRTQGDSEELEKQIALTKEISADVGELLRYLRGLNHYLLEEFQAKGYARFRLGVGEKVDLSAGLSKDTGHSEAEQELVNIIQGSKDELIAENSELDQPYEGIEEEMEPTDEEVPDEILAEIPGMSLLDGMEAEPASEAEPDPANDPALDAEASSLLDELMMQSDEEEVAANSPQELEDMPTGRSAKVEMMGNHDADTDDDELNSILDEVLEEEGFENDDSEFKFLGDDPESDDDFDLDSIFDDDENLIQDGDDDEEDLSDDELLLDLLEDDDDELVATPEGQKASPEEVLERALDMFSENRKEEGLMHLRNTVEANPNNTTLRYYYAYALARYGHDMEGAKYHLEILLKQDNQHPEAWHLLGELAENHEDYDGARRCFEKAININPGYPDIHYRLGLLTVQHFPGEEKLAAKWFRKAIKEDKQNADAEYALANLLNNRLGETEKAVKHFERTLKIQPEHPYANYDLALVHYRMGQLEQAADFYQKATLLNPALKTEQNDAAFGIETVEAHFDRNEEATNGTFSQPETQAEQEASDTDVDVAVEDGVLETDVEMAEEKEVLEAETAEASVATLGMAIEIVAEEEAIETTGEANDEEEIATTEAPAAEVLLEKTNDGPIVLISGATAGIGRATADIFAKNGYRVVITGRREERLEDVKNALSENYGADIQALTFDVRDTEAMKAALDTLPEAWREVDILINNAGLSQGLAPIHEGELEHWDTMIDTNVKGLLYLTRAVVPHMVARRSGMVINVSSGAAKEVYPGGNVYCATKSAVEALTKGMRLDLYQHNIRVGQVSPGHVEETEFARVRFDGDVERAAKTYDNFQPLRASDVAEAIFFMATRPPHVNIHDIFLNGTQQASSNFIDRSGRGG